MSCIAMWPYCTHINRAVCPMLVKDPADINGNCSKDVTLSHVLLCQHDMAPPRPRIHNIHMHLHITSTVNRQPLPVHTHSDGLDNSSALFNAERVCM